MGRFGGSQSGGQQVPRRCRARGRPAGSWLSGSLYVSWRGAVLAVFSGSLQLGMGGGSVRLRHASHRAHRERIRSVSDVSHPASRYTPVSLPARPRGHCARSSLC
jgi:hypothetical protein